MVCDATPATLLLAWARYARTAWPDCMVCGHRLEGAEEEVIPLSYLLKQLRGYCTGEDTDDSLRKSLEEGSRVPDSYGYIRQPTRVFEPEDLTSRAIPTSSEPPRDYSMVPPCNGAVCRQLIDSQFYSHSCGLREHLDAIE